jgi:hypothetical protein
MARLPRATPANSRFLHYAVAVAPDSGRNYKLIFLASLIGATEVVP